MITIAELFPFYKEAHKWLAVFREVSRSEVVRLEKEYTMCTTTHEREELRVDGIFHSTIRPAIIEYYSSGKVCNKFWRRHGRAHRENGPAHVHYSFNGRLSFEEWWEDGLLHNPNGPTFISYDHLGKKTRQEWYKHGIRHRDKGPAVIDKVRCRKHWYTNGIVTRFEDTSEKFERSLASFLQGH